MGHHKYDEKRIPDEALIFQQDLRMVLLRSETFTNIQKSMERLHGEEAKAALYEAGIDAGRDSTTTLLSKWDERGREFLERWAKFYSSEGVGWFKLDEMRIDLEGIVESFQISQSFIADSYGESSQPVCDFLCGFFVGVIEEAFGKKLECVESECVAKGDPHCKFRFEDFSE